jgi:hypothetical protein
MFRRKAIRILLTTVLAVAVVGVLSVQLLTARGGTAHASPATPITITAQVDLSTPAATGTFVASAPLCPSGTFADDILARGGGPSPVTTLLIRRTHTCDDGSGTFIIQLIGVFTPQFPGPWSVFSGTGAYTTLHGSGTSTFVLTGPTSGISTLIGEVHFD